MTIRSRWPVSAQKSVILFCSLGFTLFLLVELNFMGPLDDNTMVDPNTVNRTANPSCSKCISGKPCEYPTSVRLRIMILAYNREESLKHCLENFHDLVTDGDSIAMDIWIDLSKEGLLHRPTYRVAGEFASTWKLGQVCVHVQTHHSYIAKQWMYSWRPQRDSGEMGLIVEDDVDISPYAYRWLKSVNQTYGNDPSTYGYSLQMENVCAQSVDREPLVAPKAHTLFRNAIFGTWGFSPKGNFWRDFQDWHLGALKIDSHFKPYWKGIQANTWFKNFESRNKEESMAHEMWIMRYTLGHRDKMFCVFSNLVSHLHRGNVLLASHRAERGLHYSKTEKTVLESVGNLLMEWDSSYAEIPKDVVSFDAHGNIVRM